MKSALFLWAALLVLSGCAFTPDTMLRGAEDVPAGACMYHCFDYNIQSGGMFTSTSAATAGCVCTTVAGEGAECPRETEVETPSGCAAGFEWEDDGQTE